MSNSRILSKIPSGLSSNTGKLLSIENGEIVWQQNYAWDSANNANTEISSLKSTGNTQNTRLLNIENVNSTQNTNITNLTSWLNSNNTLQASINTTQNTNIIAIQGIDNAQNTRLTVIEGTDVTQNTNISNLTSWLSSNNTLQANINTTQNTNIALIQGVDNTQNTSISSAFVQANSAYTKANSAITLGSTPLYLGSTNTSISGLTLTSSAFNGTVGVTTPSSGNFTTLDATGNVTLGDASGDTLTINGTAVSIPNNLNFDSNTLFIDAANNQVGIGTSSPTAKLHVDGTGGIFSSGGFPYATLSQLVSSADAIFGGGVIADPSTGQQLKKTVANVGNFIRMQISDGISFHTGVTGAAESTLARTAFQRMTLDASGNLGIGTSSPGVRLDVVSISSSAVGARIRARSGADDYGFLQFTNNAGTTEYAAVSGSSGTLAFYTGTASSERMNINSAGTLTLNQGQIKFPATQNASTDANTLDDYEEGTWTPAINLLGTLTYSNQIGKYVKIGKTVIASILITVTSTDTTQDTTQVFITGLPFSINNGDATACLTERAFYTHGAAANPHRFFILPLTGAGTTLYVAEEHWNGIITNATYYIYASRKIYQGGSLYLRCSFTYFTD